MNDLPKGEFAEKSEGISLSPEEKARRGRRSAAIGLAIAGLCVLFYVITVLKIGGAVLHRTL